LLFRIRPPGVILARKPLLFNGPDLREGYRRDLHPLSRNCRSKSGGDYSIGCPVEHSEKKGLQIGRWCPAELLETGFLQQILARTHSQKVFGMRASATHNENRFLVRGLTNNEGRWKNAIVDFFLHKDNLDLPEIKIYTKTIQGWVVPNFSTVHGFAKALEQAGFKNVAFHNRLEHIRKSSKKIYYRKLLWSPVDRIKSSLGIGSKDLSSLYQRRSLIRT